MKIRTARVHPYRLGLRSPIATAHGVLTERRGFLVELMDDSGGSGWGDACPINGFGMETLSECEDALRRGCAAILQHPGGVASEVIQGRLPGARGALEVALFDLAARQQGRSFGQAWVAEAPDPTANRLPVSGLVVGDDQEAIRACAQILMDAGHQSLKLKVANRAWSEDRIRIQTLVDALRAGVQVRLDANGGWTEEQARQAMGELSDWPLELIEQPVAPDDLEAMARLREIAPCPLAADESVVRVSDLERVIELGAADMVVLKPSALGGPSASFEMAAKARLAGLTVIVTSLLDSVMGVAAASHVAARLPRDRPADGLATGSIFEQDLAPALLIVDGQLTVPQAPGLGLRPDPDSLEALRTGPPFEVHL